VSESAAAASRSFLDRHHFLLRRLHSLSGIVPVGLFVIFHLFTNMQMAFGGEFFQHEVDFIHSLPALLFLEIGLWVGIGFHAALGLVYTVTGRSNVLHYGFWGNIRYTLQRLTGVLALIFIALHIVTLRWRIDLFGWFTPFYPQYDGVDMAMPLTAYALQYHWIVPVLYFVGVMSAIFHWANGLWTAAISWGATLTPGAMQRWGYVCGGLFVALTLFFAGAFYGALSYDLSKDATLVQRLTLKRVLNDKSAGGIISPKELQREPEKPDSLTGEIKYEVNETTE
jgi:succinate dehydrogenase / fumarate reductase cytochrome b subunit